MAKLLTKEEEEKLLAKLASANQSIMKAAKKIIVQLQPKKILGVKDELVSKNNFEHS